MSAGARRLFPHEDVAVLRDSAGERHGRFSDGIPIPDVPPDEEHGWGASDSDGNPIEVERVDEAYQEEVDAKRAAKYDVVDWDELFAADDLDPDWLVDPILERGESAVIYAPHKTGKSLFTLDMIAAIASGRARLGRTATAPTRVLYLDHENSRRDLHRRLADMGYGPRDLAALIYLSFPAMPGLDTREGGAELASLARHHGAEVVVLDSTSRVVNGPEQDADTYRDMYRHTVRLLKPQGITVLRLDNSGKDTTKGQRGSSAKGDDVDVAWELTAQRRGLFRLRCSLQRSGMHPDQITVERQTGPLRHLIVEDEGTSDETPHPAINRLIDLLDAAGAPNDAGRAKARGFLPDGTRASNDDLATAVRARKERQMRPALTGAENDGQGEFEEGWP